MAELADILITQKLSERTFRPPDYEAECRALGELIHLMADAPERMLQGLADATLTLCGAESAGVSIEERDGGAEVFRWHATAGAYTPYLRGTMPRHFSPCGVVLDLNATQLMHRPAAYYQYMNDLTPPVDEVLLIPFRTAGRAVGTLWAVAHTEGRGFDGEDARIMESLARFAAVSAQAVQGAHDLRLAAAASRASEARVLGILESITDAFFALDHEWRLTYVNPMAEELLDRPSSELLGKVLWELYPGLVGSEFEGAYRRTATERTPGTVTAYFPDHHRWYEAHSYPAADGITIYFRDVTDQRLLEAERTRLTEESERQRRVYETALSNTVDFNYVFDLEGRFTYVNQTLLALWQKSLAEAVGKNFFELEYPPELAARLQEQIQQVIHTRQPLRDETPYASAVGTRAYEYIFVPVCGADGVVEAVAGSTRDITDRKEAEESDRRLAAELSEADRRKDEFLALLAHELRGPLAPLRNGLLAMRLLDGGDGPAAQTRLLMERQLAHLVRLVDDLLDVSRVGNAKMELRRERIPLADVMAAAVETVAPLIEARGQQLRVDMPREEIWLDADLTRLAQVVSNLLSNSAKYTPPNGTIALSAVRDSGVAVIEVEDDGIGIPPEALTTIFDMFSQVNRTTEMGVGGLGIGLALVKGIVELHDGSVSAASDGPGRGSRFSVRLPLAPSSILNSLTTATP